MEPMRHFQGIWISRQIWLDKRLTYFEKILLAEIHSLNGPDGCFASNEYFCEFFNERERKIQEGLCKLKELGYVYQESFDGRRRVLRTWMPENDKSLFSTSEVRNSAPLPCRNPHPSHNTYSKGDSKEQQQETRDFESSYDSPPQLAAAAFLALKKEYPEFEILGITGASLSTAVAKYTPDQIKHAMAWLKAKKDKVTTTPDQAFLWACKTQPEIEFSKEEKQQQQRKQQDDLDELMAKRREFGRRIESYCFKFLKEKGLDVHECPLLSSDGTYIEFRGRIQAKILYKEKAFKNLLESHMRKAGFPIPDFFKELK